MRTALWRLGAGDPQQQAVLRSDASAVAPAFSPDGATLAVGLFDGRVELWDVASATRVGTLQDQALPGGMAIAFGPDGRTAGRGVGRRDRAVGRRGPHPRSGPSTARSGWAPPAWRSAADGTRLAQAGLDGRVVLWTLGGADDGRSAVLPGHRERVTGVAFSPDGRTLASGDTAGTIVLSDTATLAQRAVLTGYLVTGVGFRAGRDRPDRHDLRRRGPALGPGHRRPARAAVRDRRARPRPRRVGRLPAGPPAGAGLPALSGLTAAG